VNGKKRSRFKFPRSLSVTREGKWYIGVLIFIGIAAVNTGNNLLYLIVATLLSLIIISGIMSESTLKGIKIQRQLPPLLFKGMPSRVIFKISNSKKRFPSYSFNVTEIDGPSAGAYVLKLGPFETASVSAEYIFQRRGVHRLTGLKVSTRFPFGLFTKGKEEPLDAEALILPSIRKGQLSLSGRQPRTTGARTLSGKGEGGGLYGLREYTLVDDARHIHWKSAARSERVLLKEFEKESDEKVMVVFENTGPADDLFEDLVDEAAGTINEYMEMGFSVGLRTLSSEIPPQPGREQLLMLLRELALINPEPGQETTEHSPIVKVVTL
jgi:uncharacterized protein (DUF58 family)